MEPTPAVPPVVASPPGIAPNVPARPRLTVFDGGLQPDEEERDRNPSTGPADEVEFSRLADIASRYLREDDIERLRAAFDLSVRAHEGQFRISGEPYVSHPLAVTEILSQWHLDVHALIGGLLHDVMEDSDVTKNDIATQFGKVAADLVDGVSKLDRLEFRSYEEAQAENYRKMFLAMARDVRVILIKLADRLHNMRTLDAVRPDKRRRIARETLEIYAPIANRLGLNTLYRELQELSFKHTYPLRYRVLAKALRTARGNRRELVTRLLTSIQERLPQWGVEAEVFGREKHLFGVYRKMVDKHLSFSQVLDIYGFRILVKDVPSCYLALGALHELFKPVPGKFKDYVAIPKANGYQSVHTTVIGPFGTPVEVQIRTFEMHAIAQSGVASHWLYKDESATLTDLQRKTHNWLQSLLELQTTSGDSSEFLEHVKIDLFPGDVFVFSPKGQIYNLPRGATAVDFAYAIHTDIGNRCVACRINGELQPLRTELKNGDQVEIVTAQHANPNPAWLSYVRTGKARAQIRHFLKTAQHEEATALGERLLSQALRTHGLTLVDIGATAWERFLKDNGIKTRADALTDIGLGKRLAAVVARRLGDLQDELAAAGGEEPGRSRNTSPILIHGGEGMAVQMARCCRPIPGDPIVGMLRKGQGLEIHVNDCPTLTRNRSSERDRWVEVEWETGGDRLFEVSVRVLADNRRGVLARVAAAIADQDSNIQNVSMDNERAAHTTIYFTLQVRDRIHLASIMRGVRRIPDVVRITRLRGDARPTAPADRSR
ncbi:RelA/SpoT family protein [Uliginosibacterium sp. H1]|uniref:RelA/SpoT family protein n=1 Tax=Uliginosibacterium sp. H1 TaxID=3114757 RepID=UPI002E180243|nr:bifunctional (p)ppGpp synthetase/guanosine-3',5'-bis(diphosphate) 3'-pyrophosphohydrolase [Uliginosibacterium sp. H1]